MDRVYAAVEAVLIAVSRLMPTLRLKLVFERWAERVVRRES